MGNALQAGPTGPAGLELVYRPGEDWGFGLGGAYRRLAKEINLDLYGGLLLGGELSLEDSSGRELSSDNYRATPFLALNFSWRI